MDGFLTPIGQRTRSRTTSAMEATPCATPGGPTRHLMQIPPSPCLARLGYGTGVKVLLYQRSPQASGQERSPWAIKKITKRVGQAPERDVVERIEREAQILKRLDHPNIIGFRGFKRDPDGTRILAIEKGDMSLLDIIEELREEEIEHMEEKGPLKADNILKVVRSIAQALHYLHTDKHLLHGDLKSANILIHGNFDHVQLCDFGVTLELNKQLKKKNDHEYYIGTGPWSAPEAIDDGEVTHKTDIFALGCVIYEMLALESPHINKLSTETEFSKLAESTDDIFGAFEYDDSEFEAALGTRPELPRDLEKLTAQGYEKVLSLFFACTEEDPDQRPDAKTILEVMDDEEKENGGK
ncbi:lymphokine-activated killer T-cell-originated protein kinase-like [Tigriopus californicus]|uniref:lymphokine-activated killer T-cell-originated protein kinase-like n=1 Tax=Tigriopus californicus TaxID=6832 RepID=UPI0027DAA9D3|nr:lymphokine-activated killer T-cell-originated protein kinase-like [Tigriopus californicus]